MKKTLYLGKILTLEEPLYAQAMLVEDGTISAVGTEQELLALADSDTAVVRLGENVMIPAFIDGHSHFSACANAMFQVPLAETLSFDEIGQRIQKHIKDQQVPAGKFVVAQGYDHNHLKEKAHPTKEFLDRIAPNNPLVLQHQSGHMGVMNSLALKVLGVTPETKAPDGGMIGKQNGELTGYMEENAFLYYLRQVPMPSMEELLQAFEKTQQMYASYGITTVQEGMLVEQLAHLYRTLLQQKRLWLDVVGYGDINAADSLKQLLAGYLKNYKDHFRLGGYKIFLDGSPQGRTAWMLHPYYNAADGYCGYPTMTDQGVEDAIRLSAAEGMQLLAHCNGDAAAEQYISAAERVAEGTDRLKSIKPVIVHAQLTTPAQLERAHRLGMMPSFFVAHIYHWGDVHILNFGLQRAQEISAAGSAQRMGMPFSFHQDSPVIPPDMLETIWCAVSRTTEEGVMLGKDQRLTVLQALQAVTIHAAYQYSEQEKKGSITVGKQADLVILSADPLEVPTESIRDIQVLETIKDGKTVYKKQ